MSITRLLCASLLVVLSVTSSVSAQSGAGQDGVNAPLDLNLITEPDRVRVTTPGRALAWRLEVLNAQGEPVFDSGVVTGTEIDWPLVDRQGQPIEGGRYRYTLTIGPGGAPARLQRGELQIERVRSLYQVSPVTSESTEGITLTTTEIPAPSASASEASTSDLTSPSVFRRSFSGVSFAPLINGTGTTGTMTKWLDGPGGVVGDTNVMEYNGSVLIGNGTNYGNLHIFGGATNDVFAGMGVDLINGPAFNFGYAGASFGRGAGFFNVRPDALASPPNPSLRFMTANVERMIITNEGRVGIGTSSPAFKLHSVSLSGGTAVFGQSVGGTGVLGQSPDGTGVLGQSPNGTAGKFLGKVSLLGNVGIGTETPDYSLTVLNDVGAYLNVKVDNGDKEILLGADYTGAMISVMTNHDLQIRAGGNSTKVIVKASGEFVPNSNGLQPLGNITNRWSAVYAANGTIQTSDARLKHRVTNLSDGLAAITRLRPVSFEWKATGERRRHLGLLAQEVEAVLPEVIHRDANPDAPLGLNYSELIPVAIKAIQEQQTTIARLADENAKLASRIAALEEVLSQIKRQPK